MDSRMARLSTRSARQRLSGGLIDIESMGGPALIFVLLRDGDDRRLHDLVGQRLLLGVPEREEEADVADDRIDDVADRAYDTVTGADHLAGLLADHLHTGDLVAE